MRLFLLFFLLLCGCLHFPGAIRLGKHSVTPPRDAQSPTVLTESHRAETLSLPKGSTVTETPAGVGGAPAGGKVVTYSLSEDTERTVQEDDTRAEVAPPRAPDQTVALTKVRNAERRPFLYLAIGCTIGAGALLYYHVMAVAKLAALGAAVFFVFWWAIGNERLLTWSFVGLAVVTAAYFVYADHRKRLLQGVVRTTEQSVAEFALDHPGPGRALREEYLDVNRDEAHKLEAAKAAAAMDRSYIDEQTAARLAHLSPPPSPASPPQTPAVHG